MTADDGLTEGLTADDGLTEGLTADDGLTEGLTADDDGRVRCWWPGDDAGYLAYHDLEWGRPVTDDDRLFEKLCLEGFQSGLSWLTILRKRENFRAAFAGFGIAAVAAFGSADVERLLGDAGIVRHRGKIASAINNAQRALDVIDEFGSLAAYIWSWEPDGPQDAPTSKEGLPAITAASTALARDLKRRGWSFVGPTTVYAFMQAMGLVNDHLQGCFVRPECAAERAALSRPMSRLVPAARSAPEMWGRYREQVRIASDVVSPAVPAVVTPEHP